MRFKSLITLLLLFSFFLINANNNHLKAYQIEVNAPFAKGDKAYLGHYWKGEVYVLDSTTVSTEGIALFKNDKKLNTGQYILYIKPSIQMELLLSEDDTVENKIKIRLDKDLNKSTIDGSRDTKLYWAYIKELNKLNQKLEQKLSRIKDTQPESTDYNKVEAEYIQSIKDVDNYRRKEIEDNKGSWFSDFVKASSINLHGPHFVPKNQSEFSENKKFIRDHYFDNVDFTDTRLWNTSFFVSNMNHYLNDIVPQQIDSVAYATSYIVGQSVTSDKAFELLLSHFFNDATTSKQMWKENVWVKLAQDYIFDKNVNWIDSTQYSNLKASYSLIEQNLIGMKAQNLSLVTLEGDSIDTNGIEAEYTLLYFYSPSCGHCEREMPKLRNEIFPKYKELGMTVIAFDTERDKDRWIEFIEKHDLKTENWVNVSDPNFKSDYWLKYNVEGTPSLYLIDKNKTIIAKKLDMENLEKFMTLLLQ